MVENEIQREGREKGTERKKEREKSHKKKSWTNMQNFYIYFLDSNCFETFFHVFLCWPFERGIPMVSHYTNKSATIHN